MDVPRHKLIPVVEAHAAAPVLLDAARAVRHLDELVEVYAVAMRAPAAQLPGRRAIMSRHLEGPDFRCLASRRDGHIAGFAYGFTGRPGQWWYDVVRTALIAARGVTTADAWLDSSFEIGEVHVRPEYQGAGIGRTLVSGLCATAAHGPAMPAIGPPHRTAVLSTPDAPTRARRLYADLGFTDLLAAYRFPGTAEPFAVLGAALPLGRVSPE